MSDKVVLASANPGKLEELAALLADTGLEVVPLSQFSDETPEETGLSFVENAILKARHAAQVSKLPAIADDSGLSVDGLAGEPGIYSARYAGPNASDADNVRKLLAELDSNRRTDTRWSADRRAADERRDSRYRSKTDERRDNPDRFASFISAVAYVRHGLDPMPILGEGIWHGEIAREPKGEGGFGYDPVFYLASRGCTAAELDPKVKNTISHRAQALNALVERLRGEKYR